MPSFSEFSVWAPIALFGTLLISLLGANMIKKNVPFLRESLIPTSVLGGIMLLLISVIYEAIAGKAFFDTTYFGGNGTENLETITYHALALGFIATAFKPASKKHSKRRGAEIFNTGVTTVSTYLLQGTIGMGFTLLVALFLTDFFSAAGILLPFGFGQGPGQALNYGRLYADDYGFLGGDSFGLTVAGIGFLAAALGGVLHLNLLKRRGYKITHEDDIVETVDPEDIQAADDIPMNSSMDKITVQFAFVFGVYMLTHAFLLILGSLIPGLQSVLYGFNFLFGVLFATTMRLVCAYLRRRGIMKKQYVNGFLLDRISGFFFDLMVVASIAAIRINVLGDYWWIILSLCAIGTVATYFYNRFVARKFFPRYAEEQFLMMYGMLTGTASTGLILMREIDPDFKTPAANNLVYQNFPAIVFGFPMMILATLAPKQPLVTFLALAGLFVVMNIILFRRQIFCRRIDRAAAAALAAAKESRE